MDEITKIGEIDGKSIYHDKYCKEGQYTREEKVRIYQIGDLSIYHILLMKQQI